MPSIPTTRWRQRSLRSRRAASSFTGPATHTSTARAFRAARSRQCVCGPTRAGAASADRSSVLRARVLGSSGARRCGRRTRAGPQSTNGWGIGRCPPGASSGAWRDDPAIVKRLDAARVYYGLELFTSMPAFVFTAVHLVRDLHMTPLQLVLMGTVMEAAVFLFEVPTGVVADAYSRRASLIVSFVIQGVAIVLVGAANDPALAIAAWGLWGFGYTFMSGAWQAWITDEVGVDRVGGVFLRGARIGFVGSFLGLGLQAAIATQSLRGAVIFGGIVTILSGVACIFVMPETGFRRRPREERGRALAELRRTATT